jgi:hypothetical protein
MPKAIRVAPGHHTPTAGRKTPAAQGGPGG